MTAKLPLLDHFTLDDAEEVYEPSDDTFLLCDAILKDKELLCSLKPNMILEIGCGSGCVITYIEQLLMSAGIHAVYFGADINSAAALVSARTAAANKCSTNLILSDLAGNVLDHKIDILIFNPPYVPTPSEEVGSHGIEAAWAGGEDGREVIDLFLPKLQTLLAPGGRCYLVLVQENKPTQISELLREMGFAVEISLKRRAKNELLMILTIQKP